MIRKSALTLFLLVLVLATRAQTADEILNKYFENTGGVEKQKSLKTRKLVGKMNMQNMDFPITIYQKAPEMQRTEISIQGLQIVQAYDGTDAWMINPMQGGTTPVKMTEEEAKDLTDRPFEDALIDYQEKGHAVELQGTEEVEGVKCHKIQLIKNKNNDKEDVTEVYYFDAENFVPIMLVSYARSGPAKGQALNTYLSDYQEVDGLMIPFFMETKLNGQSFQKLTMEKVTFNEPMEDSLFTFPK